MAEDIRQRSVSATGARTRAAFDEGLRAYMLNVYNYMASAMLLTGAVALMASRSEALMQTLFGTPLAWVVIFAPLVMVFFLSARLHKMQTSTAKAMFWLYAALVGLSISYIFLAYTGASIARTFFITAAAFGSLSLWGYTTKKDLTGWGTFLIMGVIGLLIAMVVNMFLASSALHFVVSAGGVLIFAGLTAYDTQKIKEMYHGGDSSDVATRKSIMGALRLYLDFLNLFLFMLQFLGSRE